MPSPEAPSESSTSSNAILQPKPTAHRSILSFWGNGNDNAKPTNTPSPASTISQGPLKKRRKRADDDGKQGRLIVNHENGGAWGIGRGPLQPPSEGFGEEGNGQEGGVVENKIGKGRRRKKKDPEEEERKDMIKKAREAEKALGLVKKAVVGNGKGRRQAEIQEEVYEARIEIDPSNAEHREPMPNPQQTAESTSPNPSPKRKRGRPKKGEGGSPGNKQIQPRSGALAIETDLSPSASGNPDIKPQSRHRSSSPFDVVITGHIKQPPVSHTLSRTSSTTGGGGTSHQPIDVESQARAGPSKKLVFASDAKPAHSFFSRLNNGLAPPSSSRGGSVVSDAGSTKSEVTTVSQAQAQVNGSGKPGKVHSFFRINGDSENGAVKIKNGWGGGLREGEEWQAPLPGGLWPTHEGETGFYTFPVGSILRRRSHIPAIPNEGDFWNTWIDTNNYSANSTKKKQDRLHDSRCPIHDSHPAITSIHRKLAASNRETWCDRYRPRKAVEVLGNEIEATYLRDWLTALEVGTKDGESNRKVIRKVGRRKASNLFDGFIVDDIGLFGDVDDEDEDEDEDDEIPEEIEEPYLKFGERPNIYPSIDHRLTNTILLSGPHGSGKSAAIYAVAAELGWDVFEVYPGIGKRTGSNLMTLVGDVGRNHMVVTGKTTKVEEVGRTGVEGPLRSFFGRVKDKSIVEPVPMLGSQGSSVEKPVEVELELELGLEEGSQDARGDPGNGVLEESTVIPEGDHRVRQSLILIDDVDILFEDESTFWPAIVSLVAESRRPIILTCNEPPQSLCAQLPLQACLKFQPPPSHVAIPYLEAIAENNRIPPRSVTELYNRSIVTSFSDIIDQPLPPNGHEPIPYFDLRKAISQMQLDRSLANDTITGTVPQDKNLDREYQRLEMISFVDAHVDQRVIDLIEISEVDRYNHGGPDDEFGIEALVKPDVEEFKPILAGFDRSSDMADYLSNSCENSTSILSDLASDRARYINSLLPILDPLIPLSSHLLPHQSLFLDIMPTVRNIVEADDVLQAEDRARMIEGVGRVNRKTGRPIRISANVFGSEGYVRYLDFKGEEDIVRRSGFGG